MITEDYVSFETAKLLKEKGFDEPCYKFYNYDSKKSYRETDLPCCNSRSDDYSAPTIQMAMKWLRNKGVFIMIWILTDNGYWYDIEKIQDESFYHKSLYNSGIDDIYYPTYEEAVEASLKYSLENFINNDNI